MSINTDAAVTNKPLHRAYHLIPPLLSVPIFSLISFLTDDVSTVCCVCSLVFDGIRNRSDSVRSRIILHIHLLSTPISYYAGSCAIHSLCFSRSVHLSLSLLLLLCPSIYSTSLLPQQPSNQVTAISSHCGIKQSCPR